MRQLARGVLATLALAMAACGNGGGSDVASAGDAPVDGAALAASSKISTPDQIAPGAASLTIAVSSPEGVDSVGLDVAASVLLARPDTEVVVVAPATDARATPHARSASALSPVPAETLTGHLAEAVNGSLLDVVDVLTAPGAAVPDLLVIGLTDDAGRDSATMAGAALAVGRGVPVLVVDVSGTDPDLAGAGLLLGTVTDYELDALLEAPGVHVLTVPACTAGTIRGPVVVDASPLGGTLPVVDCTSPETGPFDDEIDAWAAGHATLAAHAAS